LLIGVVVILFTIGFTPYLTQNAFALAPTITSYVADDPNDLNTVWDAGDTITINLSAGVNATTGNVRNAIVTGNFTFPLLSPIAGATYTSEWISTSVLRLTFSVVGTNTPIIGSSTTIDVNPTNNLGITLNNTDNTVMQPATDVNLSGDFGLFVAATTSTDGGGGCTDCTAPTLGMDDKGRRLVDNGFTYNGNAIDVERYFTPYPLVTVSVGKQNVAEFKIYDDKGPDSVSHFELAFGLANGESIGKSKAVINWDRAYDGVETITIDDPENVLDKINITTSEGYCSDESQQKCLIVKVTHTFRAPLDFNILGTNVWDTKRNAWQNYYNHGIEVVGESLNPPNEYDGINAGQIYHLTETSKTTAIDEFGNTWSLQFDLWTMDYIPNEKIIGGIAMNGYTRENSQFEMYKFGQQLLAENKLNEMCSECSDEPYTEIEDIFAYDYPIVMSPLENPEIQKTMSIESEKAQNVLEYILDPILYLK